MALGFFSSLFGKKGGASAAPSGIFFWNTLSGAKEEFDPIRAGQVKMYHCGPTVYGFQHIGNYRSYVFADTLKRLFLAEKYSVKQVINITDVGHLVSDEDEGEDKVEAGAKREKKSVAEIVALYTDDFMDTLGKLNIDTNGTIFPRATHHIAEQIAMIETLEEKGYTYRTSDGLYFDTSLFTGYGKLGHIDIEHLKEGARVAANPEKKHPTDFALWKFSPKDGKREQEWESPWGVGFPGWHIECSAMSSKYLGRHFDIHTGGIDHIATHHQNEIAQSESAYGRKWVNYWLHNAHVLVDGQKISKSLGNTILIKNIEDRGISPLAYRYWLLTSHYRTSVNFTWEALGAAATALWRLQRLLAEELEGKEGKINEGYSRRFKERIHDDLDTAGSVAVMWELVKDESVPPPSKKATILFFDKYLGLGLSRAAERIKEMAEIKIPDEVANILKEREEARKAKDFAKSDALRDKISSLGFEVSDTESGQKVSKKSQNR